MNDCFRLPIAFAPESLRADLTACRSADWVEHFVRKNYEGSWHVLPLRAPAGAEHPILMIYPDPSCKAFVATSMLERCPYIERMLDCFDCFDCFDCELDAVRLMRLGAGSIIREHRDLDLSIEEDVVRLHVPIVTDEKVDFRLNGRSIRMRAGECWYLRLSDPHSVANRSRQDRVHLVIDAQVNDWLRALLEEAAAAPP